MPKTQKQITFTNEAEFEKAVLERLSKVLPVAVHDAVQACLVQERPVQNNVREPKVGGKCYTVWKELDKLQAAGKPLTLRGVLKIAQSKHWNQNNARVEFYNWRKFHGMSK